MTSENIKQAANSECVLSVSPPLLNLYSSDSILQKWVNEFKQAFSINELASLGDVYGKDLYESGEDANRSTPEFHSHDRFGRRIDKVVYHPAYHQFMQCAIQAQMPSLPWVESKSGAHVIRTAMQYMHMQVEAGSACPLTMTFASVAAIKHSPVIAQLWIPKILSAEYDYRDIPYFDKKGLTIGMAMTEKQGGSDVRANSTHALAISSEGNGEAYELTGHKWFCSAPMCDAFLVLAQTEQGLSCFLLPRWRPDGSKNQFHIQRLKNKLGNRSNASSEVEFNKALAWMIGEPGKGLKCIMEMVALTRFDCMVGSSALMRASLAQALLFTHERKTFGVQLQKHPLMQNVLADLAIESEAAIAFSMRVANAFDNSDSESEKLFIRIATAIGKYWICKRAPHFVYEAMECLGGIGYVEDNYIARMYREAPVNAIWEGSGNIQCLDFMRTVVKEKESLTALVNELGKGKNKYIEYDHHLTDLLKQLKSIGNKEFSLRVLIDKIAVATQASILIQYGDPLIAKAFCQSRLVPTATVNFGTLGGDIDASAIIKRAMPSL
ncbi:DNA alkylation response protein [Parashewanella spongiae]|uniref:DNA alkylation response protein n=1 Tax=Parashewanella spongiae TaxID=342950 RepID=A0A3A6TX54_9GAMM|nr:acyl-CoA dehydrogenase family protein [Parashewanella spongiae]MCL1078900.1 acyl-CoA dehydrogenase family protein [Parashewanella spongiae]RJY19050.1 DNA alkylation response protein [Parashewanella spongiae]